MSKASWWQKAVLAVAAVFGMTATAVAGVIPIGTITGGTGTVNVTPPAFGVPNSFSFGGAFQFDSSLAAIFGDVGQFGFNASSSGVGIFDDNTAAQPLHAKGLAPWEIQNNTSGGSLFYGPSFSWTPTFAADFLSGTIDGLLTTDGFVHWYYGYDETVGPPAGKTALPFTELRFTGQFQTTGFSAGPGGTQNATFNFTGSLFVIPEPATLALTSLALIGLGLSRRRATA